jgi:hypothetical protein
MGRIRKGKIGMPKAKKTKPPPRQNAASDPSVQSPTAEAAPSSPKAQKPGASCADVPPPQSPGKDRVKALASIVKELARGVAMAERKKRAAAAADKESSEVYDRVLEAAGRTIARRDCTAKQLARAEKSVDTQIVARAEAEKAVLRAECLWFCARLELEMAKVKAGEAKLASMKRRLRRRKVFGLMRWR